MSYLNALIYLVAGLLIVSLIDTAGSIASRKLNFKYGYLTILSGAVYIYIGYLASKEYSITTALLINGLIGLYDGTIGLKFSIILKAKEGLSSEKVNEVGKAKIAFMMINIAFVFALAGFLISRF